MFGSDAPPPLPPFFFSVFNFNHMDTSHEGVIGMQKKNKKRRRIKLGKVLCRKFNMKFQFPKGHRGSDPLVLTDKWDVHSEIKP